MRMGTWMPTWMGFWLGAFVFGVLIYENVYYSHYISLISGSLGALMFGVCSVFVHQNRQSW